MALDRAGSESRISFVAVGSAMFTRRLTAETHPSFLALLEIIRRADAAFLNLEGPVWESTAYPVKQYIFSSYFTSEPWLPQELRWAGFDLVSLANNHMSDWSPESIYTNQRLLTEAGLVWSGAGRTLTEARAPGYLETPKGRIALLSVDSSYEFGEFFNVQMASDPHGSVPGRPGVSGLRFNTTYELDRQSFDHLRRIYRALELHREGLEIAYEPPYPSDDRFKFRGVLAKRGDQNRVVTSCWPSDLGEIVRWVRNAALQSDYVIVSHHSHTARGAEWELPVDYVQEIAHAVIDAGAHAYIGHGYTSKGIEIYRGYPIFYDVGTFASEDASAQRHPADAYERWGLDPKATPGEFADARRVHNKAPKDSEVAKLLEAVKPATDSVVALFAFEAGKLAEVELYPHAETGGDLPRHRIGVPLLASGESAQKILGRFQRASAPFGTTIDIVGDIGKVRWQ